MDLQLKIFSNCVLLSCQNGTKSQTCLQQLLRIEVILKAKGGVQVSTSKVCPIQWLVSVTSLQKQTPRVTFSAHCCFSYSNCICAILLPQFQVLLSSIPQLSCLLSAVPTLSPTLFYLFLVPCVFLRFKFCLHLFLSNLPPLPLSIPLIHALFYLPVAPLQGSPFISALLIYPIFLFTHLRNEASNYIMEGILIFFLQRK